MKLGGRAGFWLLQRLSKSPCADVREGADQDEFSGAAKLELHFGKDVWNYFVGRRVLDFGCGKGTEAVAVAQRGAAVIYGIDVQEGRLAAAKDLAMSQGVAGRCQFFAAAKQRDEIEALHNSIDCAYSLDSFEHFADPPGVLGEVHRLLVPGGRFLVSFGPPWNHPYGSHVWFFTSVPWVHLLFTEDAIMSVRARYRSDGAKRFEEVEGGLNRMTVARFLRLVENSRFQTSDLELIPVKRLEFLVKRPWSREYFTSVVRCQLTKLNTPASPEANLT